MSKRKLFDHQIIARDFLAGDAGHLLAGEPGTGKTSSAIVSADKRGAKNVLVFCPPVALSTWIREVRLTGTDLIAVDGKRKPKDIAAANIVALSLNWARYPKAREIAASRKWDIVFVDEAHRASNPDSALTKAVYDSALVKRVGSIEQLTGTPTPKHAGQLWRHVSATAPERIDNMSYAAFTDRYCRIEMRIFGNMRHATPFIAGNRKEMIPELRQRLAGWWLRQRKADVLKFLPPKVYNRVDMPVVRADLKAIEAEMDPEVYEALEFAAETGDARTLSLMGEEVASLRRLIARVKAKYVVEYVLSILEDGVSPIAVWGWHTDGLEDVQRLLRAAGLRVGLIYGATPQRERDRIEEDFQGGRLDVFVGQIVAAGVAITLTATSRAVFMEEAFTAADNDQASDRHHRIGQKDSLQIDRIILSGTIDEAVAAIVERRTEEYEQLSEGV